MPMLGETGYTTQVVTVPLTAVGDTFIPIPYNAFIVRRCTLFNPSSTMATSAASIGFFSAAGGSGTISATATATGLTAARKFLDRTIASPATTDILAPAAYTNPQNGQVQYGIFCRVTIIDDGTVKTVQAAVDVEAVVPSPL